MQSETKMYQLSLNWTEPTLILSQVYLPVEFVNVVYV